MDCEKLPTCIFFNDQMLQMPAVTEVLKKQYCRGAYEDCARYRVAKRLGADGVPKDLYPNDLLRGETLLAAAP